MVDHMFRHNTRTVRILSIAGAMTLTVALVACSSSNGDEGHEQADTPASQDSTSQSGPTGTATTDDDDTGTSSGVDPTELVACDLLNEDEVSSAIGLEVTSQESFAPNSCSWKFEDSESGHGQMLVMSTGMANRFDLLTGSDIDQFQPISGIGEKATLGLKGPSGWATEDQVTAGSATMIVLKDNMTLLLELERYELERGEVTIQLSGLATSALGRID